MEFTDTLLVFLLFALIVTIILRLIVRANNGIKDSGGHSSDKPSTSADTVGNSSRKHVGGDDNR